MCKKYDHIECVKNMITLKENLLQRWKHQGHKIIHMGVSTIPSVHLLLEILSKFRKVYKDKLKKTGCRVHGK